ncbi:hypothetical protein [Jatrophihabitans lederbergiae]|uniref:Lipoprotein n=1 Tax=Jatrophihabitans lederbergiae TaxID=3075547 RepID=A0ABU2J908_9ACTN|nr:hypothetical protein [Jatrophihabitans sp. DSM 44399]MDT0261465.1 hypothetical protein [Jatrophihabitans sp. DSM 44399]
MLNTFDAVKSARSKIAAVAALSAVLLVPACGSNGGSSPTHSAPSTGAASSPSAPGASSGATSSGTGPVGVEVHPPGDIPDNQAFVPYSGVGFTVTTPEGWARSNAGSAVVFSDKYNSITVTTAASAQAPTTVSARMSDLPAIKAASKGFAPGAVSVVQRKAGSTVLITYRAYSPVNPVTWKVANEAVERYTFWKGGTSVTLTLAAPVGSDNVDPWRTVTDSFAWTK